MPPKRKRGPNKKHHSSDVEAGARKYVLREAGEGELGEEERMTQQQIDEIYNGIPEDGNDGDEEKDEVINYVAKKPNLVSSAFADTDDEAVEVKPPLKEHQTTFAMVVSPERPSLPPAVASSKTHLVLVKSSTAKSAPGNDDFAIARPANPYLNQSSNPTSPNRSSATTQQDSTACPPNNHNNGPPDDDDGSDDDDDDDSTDSIKALLLGSGNNGGMPLGELASANEGRCYLEYLQGGMVLFTGYNGNAEPAFTLHATIAAKYRMPPFDRHVCSGVNFSVAPNSNERLRASGNKCYTGVVVSYATFKGHKDLLAFFRQYVRFLNTHTYMNPPGKITPLPDRIHHQPNLTSYRSAMTFDITQDPKRRLGDLITLSDAIDHLQRVNPMVFDRTVYSRHRSLITRYFGRPYNSILNEHFGFPLPDHNDEAEDRDD